MTVGECKIKALALMDENDLTDDPYSGDADIVAKLPLFMTMGARVIAQQQPIVKKAVFTNPYTSDSASEGYADPLEDDYLLFDMPSDFYRMERICHEKVVGIDRGKFTPDGKLQVTGEGKWLVYYHAMPSEITNTTSNDTVIPLSEDCALALPYYVAANVMMADGDAGWVNYMSQFNMILSSMTPGKTSSGARIVV